MRASGEEQQARLQSEVAAAAERERTRKAARKKSGPVGGCCGKPKKFDVLDPNELQIGEKGEDERPPLPHLSWPPEPPTARAWDEERGFTVGKTERVHLVWQSFRDEEIGYSSHGDRDPKICLLGQRLSFGAR